MSNSTEAPSRTTARVLPTQFQAEHRADSARAQVAEILPVRTRSIRGLVRSSLDETIRQQLARNPAELLPYTLETVKHSATGSVLKLRLPGPSESCDCFLKIRVLRGPWVLLLRYLGWSRLRCAWNAARQFHRVGIFCPQPLAFVSEFHRHEIREYLLTLAVPESVALHNDLAENNRTASDQLVWRRTLCVQLGGQLRRLHQLGFDHRDLKASNFLVRENARRNPAPCIVDLEGVRRWPVLPEVRRQQNLVRLNLSADAHQVFTRTDRLRFLREYLGDQAPHRWKDFWRRLAPLSIKRRQQFQRLHKPLH